LRLSFGAVALHQIKDIRDYISRDNPVAAMAIVSRIEQVATFISDNPGVGRSTVIRGMRAFPVTPYPYVIYFHRLRDEVRIVRVLHSARRRPELREDGPAYLAQIGQAR
jgi:toxin ParE1/3/4